MTIFNNLKPSTLTSSFSQLVSDKYKIRPRLISLKLVLTSVVLSTSPAMAQQPAAKPTVVAGSDVNISSITNATWIQGEGPKAFEPDKVYIFECWATWCGPCIAMIPHVNELHKKYYDKGLRVYGLSVWENEKDKVIQFVKKKGDKMSYPVAFTGNASAFETEWLKAAGATSIPHAFIVKNGKLLASTQASRLTDSLIESLLAGDEGAKKASDTILSAQNNQGKAEEVERASYAARLKKDAAKMTELLKELNDLDPDHPAIPTLKLWILIVSKQWPEAVTTLNEMPTSEYKSSFISLTGMQTARMNNYGFSEEFMKAFVKQYSDYVLNNESPIGPNHFASLSILQWNLNDKQSAVTTAEKCVAAAKAFSKGEDSRVQPYARFAKSVNEGNMPEISDLSQWQREAREAAAKAK
ncbi:MAG: redoxin family protein [Akkermansiaceae bacterium]